MGDRAQIAVKQAKGAVYLYSQWGGSEINRDLAKALWKGRDRWGDEEYLTRIIFQQMIGEDVGNTGFGIGLMVHGDIEHPIPLVDIASGRIWMLDESGVAPPGTLESMSFEEFIREYLT